MSSGPEQVAAEFELQQFIDGDWQAATGEKTRALASPATGDPIARVSDSSPEDVNRAVAAARSAQPKWERASAWERARICHAVAERLEASIEDLATDLTREQGKPFHAEAMVEIAEAAANFRIAAEDVKRLESSLIPAEDPKKRILTFRRANGVYGLITPWNYPVQLPTEMIAPGIAAGNTVVIKPSEWTPLAMVNLARVMAEAGLPDGVVNVVFGAGEVGGELVGHPEVDCVGFVGSHPTAERVVRAAGLKRTLIEASGNGPVIVCADGDVREAAKGAVFGGFYCAGQVCCATERVLVHVDAYERFLESVVDEVRSWPLGDPFDAATKVGPLTNEPTAKKMELHVADALEGGARLVTGGSRRQGFPTDLYFEPTVIDGVRPDALINKEETFGPIVPLTPVADDEAAIAMANDSVLGLRAAVYTDSIKTAFRYIDALRVGNVVINDSTNYGEAHLPFGGAAGTRSGWGRMGGRFTMADMTQIQTAALSVR